MRAGPSHPMLPVRVPRSDAGLHGPQGFPRWGVTVAPCPTVGRSPGRAGHGPTTLRCGPTWTVGPRRMHARPRACCRCATSAANLRHPGVSPKLRVGPRAIGLAGVMHTFGQMIGLPKRPRAAADRVSNHIVFFARPGRTGSKPTRASPPKGCPGPTRQRFPSRGSRALRRDRNQVDVERRTAKCPPVMIRSGAIRPK